MGVDALRRTARNIKALLTEELTATARGVAGGGIVAEVSRDATLADYMSMRRDPEIGLGLALIKAPIIGAEWWVDSDNEEAARFIEENLKALWLTLMRTSLTAVEFGFAAHEKVFRLDGGRYVLDSLADLKPTKVELLIDEKGKFGGIRYKPGGGADAIDLPVEKCFIFTHGREWGDLYGVSRLANAEAVWRREQKAAAAEDRYFERKADPQIVGRAPAGKQTDASGSERDNFEAMATALAALRSGGAIIVPAGEGKDGKPAWDVELLQDDKRGDMFTGFVDHLDNKKFRALLIPDRILAQQDTGAYDLVEAVTKTFIRMEETLLSELFDHVQKYIVDKIVALNFGEGVSVALKHRDLSDETKAAIAEVVKTLATQPASWPDFKDRVDVDAMIEMSDLPLKAAPARAARLALDSRRGVPARRAARRMELAVTREAEAEAEIAAVEAFADAASTRFLDGVESVSNAVASAFTPGIGPVPDIALGSLTGELSRALLAGDILGRYQVIKDAADRLPATRLSRYAGAPMHFAVGDVDVAAAIAFLKNKKALSDEEYSALEETYQRRAFAVAGVESAGLNERIKEILVDAVEKGGTKDDFAAAVKSAFEAEGLSPLSRAHSDIVFRQNVMSAYAAGRWEALQSAPVKDVIPAYMYVTIGDDKVRPAHAAMHGRIFAADDPIWLVWWPPNGFRCRCWVVGVDRFDIEDGLAAIESSAGVLVQPDPGFGYNVGVVGAERWAI